MWRGQIWGYVTSLLGTLQGSLHMSHCSNATVRHCAQLANHELLSPGMNKEQLQLLSPMKKHPGLQNWKILLHQVLDRVTVTSPKWHSNHTLAVQRASQKTFKTLQCSHRICLILIKSLFTLYNKHSLYVAALVWLLINWRTPLISGSAHVFAIEVARNTASAHTGCQVLPQSPAGQLFFFFFWWSFFCVTSLWDEFFGELLFFVNILKCNAFYAYMSFILY